MEVKIKRALVNPLARVQAAILMHRKARCRGENRSQYERSFIGMCGELAFHFYAQSVGAATVIELPRLGTPLPYNHTLILQSPARLIRIESKTICPRDGRGVTRLRVNDKIPIPSTTRADFCSVGVISGNQLHAPDPDIAVTLVAFVPINFVQQHARHGSRFPRFVEFGDIPAAMTPCALDVRAVRTPMQIACSEQAMRSLRASPFEERIVEALSLLRSDVSATSLFDALAERPDILNAARAFADDQHCGIRAQETVA